MELSITDPQIARAKSKGATYLRDARDTKIVWTAVKISVVMGASVAMVALYVEQFWWVALVHISLYLFFMGPLVLMLHAVSHRPLFAKPKILNKFVPWILAPLFGQPPESYFAHHMSMHHREGNGPDDLSSTMRYQRDSFLHWLHYFLKFFIIGLPELCIYLYKNGFHKILRKLILGELTWFAVAAITFYYSPAVSITLFIAPIILTRILLMAGNWAQHAFVDPERWDNDYATVTTFINSTYNHRCFNDGYHLAHHIKPGCHWAEMPGLFETHIERMKEEKSLVFRKLDYFVIWALLMTKRHHRLASYIVDLDDENPMTMDEKVALIKSRLVPVKLTEQSA